MIHPQKLTNFDTYNKAGRFKQEEYERGHIVAFEICLNKT